MAKTRCLIFSLISLMIVLTPAHVMAAKKVSPKTVSGATTVSTAEAKRLFDQGATFLDVRSNRDWEAGRIPGSHHIELKKKFNEDSLGAIIEKGQPIVIYCNSTGCMRSSKACAKAVGWGYTNVYYYRLGFPDWKGAGYAIQ